MGTGGNKNLKASNKDSAEAKMRAITTIVKNGRRGSEWQEAGLLHAIEKIIDGHNDLSADGLVSLMREAARN